MNDASRDAECTRVLSYRYTVRLGLSEHLLQKQIMDTKGEIHVIITCLLMSVSKNR